jgi:3-dehydroquinate synthase
MKKKSFRFSKSSVDYYFDVGFASLGKIVDKKNAILVTDENIFRLHEKKFESWKTVIISPGESNKVQAAADEVIRKLIDFEADRSTILVGVGGGVVTDLTGYVASVYMRGISFGFIPTSLLAMVDASIGGKNGIDVGMYKNMVGTIRQPSFIIFDPPLLKTLPDAEWRNGFAEIIKHAAIKDAAMFRDLEHNELSFYKENKKQLSALIQRNALLKTRVVQKDEFEKGDRKLLNFGHTLGHALENQYALSHGEAISIGMVRAAFLSEKLVSFKDALRVKSLLNKYGLPVDMDFDRIKMIGILKMDKKKSRNEMNFILLTSIGRAVIRQIAINQLQRDI